MFWHLPVRVLLDIHNVIGGTHDCFATYTNAHILNCHKPTDCCGKDNILALTNKLSLMSMEAMLPTDRMYMAILNMTYVLTLCRMCLHSQY